ncbi:MAG: efflux RND transporter periplasmic adaptor subunit [Verrucomicrobiales bacterium]|nr:efflux RND transporter periplasmic adaptor subunit [Verrucomicrobiales bacterium]
MTNRKKLIPLLALVLVFTGLTYVLVWGRSGQDLNVIRVSGNIEVTDAEVSFKIPGRVEARLISEGQVVKAGQTVAQLDSTELALEVALRRAELMAAEAALAELEAGSRPEEIAEAQAAARQAEARLEEFEAGSRSQDIAAAEAALQRAKAEAARLRIDHERYKQLYAEGIVSAQLHDAARTAHEMAEQSVREAEEQLKLVREGPRKEQIGQARESLRQARERALLVKKGPRQETIAQARARVEQARQVLAVAETRLAYATVTSPINGVVLSENVEGGEYVAAGTPVVTVGELEKPWVRAFINETDLGRVKVGQRVCVSSDTYPDKRYEGYVSFIASQAEFTPKTVQTEKERVKLVYRVKVEVANPQMELKPGMPVDADIWIGKGAKSCTR